MTDNRPQIGLACNVESRDDDAVPAEVERLTEFADFHYCEFNEPSDWYAPPPADSPAVADLIEFASTLDGLIVCHGSPRVTGAILDAAPSVRIVGELEGDRFAQRIDVEAASMRGVKAVDTTNGSSYGVAEWALAMSMIGLRNAGSHFRRLIAGEVLFEDHSERNTDPGYIKGELTGRTVGLIGAGPHRAPAARAASSVPGNGVRARPVCAARTGRHLRRHLHVSGQRAVVVRSGVLPCAAHPGHRGHDRQTRDRTDAARNGVRERFAGCDRRFGRADRATQAPRHDRFAGCLRSGADTRRLADSPTPKRFFSRPTSQA